MWTLLLIHLKMSHLLDSLPIQVCMKSSIMLQFLSPLYRYVISLAILSKLLSAFRETDLKFTTIMSTFLFVLGLLLIIMLVVLLIWRSHKHSGKVVVNLEDKSHEMSAITNPMSEYLCAYIYSNEYSYLALIHIKEC